MPSSAAAAFGTPAAPFFYVPGPLEPVRVNLDDWPGWHRGTPWPGAPPDLRPLDVRPPVPAPVRGRAPRPPRPTRGARTLRFPPPAVHLPRGPAVVWVGTPWVVHTPAPAVPPPGTPEGDLRLVASRSAGDPERLAALDRTVARVPWAPRRPAVRRALAARTTGGGDASSAEALRQELRAAICLVLGEGGRPQRHRFGRSWAAGPDGRPAELLPERLPPAAYWRWFCDEVRKAAEASLLGEAYPGAARRAGVPVAADLDAFPAEDDGGDPLALLLRQERRREAGDWWRAALGLATPRQRELLGALDSLHRGTAGTAAEPTLADAASLAGMAPSTARVQWMRLVERLRAQRSGHA